MRRITSSIHRGRITINSTWTFQIWLISKVEANLQEFMMKWNEHRKTDLKQYERITRERILRIYFVRSKNFETIRRIRAEKLNQLTQPVTLLLCWRKKLYDESRSCQTRSYIYWVLQPECLITQRNFVELICWTRTPSSNFPCWVQQLKTWDSNRDNQHNLRLPNPVYWISWVLQPKCWLLPRKWLDLYRLVVAGPNSKNLQFLVYSQSCHFKTK